MLQEKVKIPSVAVPPFDTVYINISFYERAQNKGLTSVNLWRYIMRKKGKKKITVKKFSSYYSLTEIRRLIDEGKVVIRKNALDGARRDFGWDPTDILDTIKQLRAKDFYKTDASRIKPAVMIDVYKARGLKGENVYTHFYIHARLGKLVINSFKEI